MDFVFCQGVKCTYILSHRHSRFSLNLLSFLYKYPKVAVCRQIHYQDKHRDHLCHLNNFDISSNQNDKRFIIASHKCIINTIQYSNFFKSNYSTKSELPIDDSGNLNVKNISLFQKMKQLTKNYWNVLLPVHIATSLCWVSMFYIAIKYGIDIIGILKSLHLNDKYLDALRNSNVGDWALTYALYKIFTPIRYTVTIGMTTACVKYLKNIGYLKSVKNMEVSNTFN